MNCLSCENTLTTVTEKELFHKLTYDICEDCGGLWLDKGELDRIAFQTPGSIEISSVDYLHAQAEAAGGEPIPKKLLISTRNCRRCPDKAMFKLPFMGEEKIMLDYCNQCGGLWLDGGELDQVNEYIKWFDKKAKPSHFDHFLKHMHSTYWHEIIIEKQSD